MKYCILPYLYLIEENILVMTLMGNNIVIDVIA